MPKHQLTELQLTIVKMVCQEKTSKEIGEALELSYRTVEDHRNTINKKLNTSTPLGVLKWAIKNKMYKV